MLFEYNPYTDEVPRLGKLKTGKNFISLFFSHSESPIVRQLYYPTDIYKVLVEKNNIYVITQTHIESITLDNNNFEFGEEDIVLAQPKYVLPRMQLLKNTLVHNIPLDLLLTYNIFLKDEILYFSSKSIKPHILYKYCDGNISTFDSMIISPERCNGFSRIFSILSSETYILEVIYKGEIQYLWCNNNIYEILNGYPIISKTANKIGLVKNGKTTIYDSEGLLPIKILTLPFESSFYTDDEVFYNHHIYSLKTAQQTKTLQNIDCDTTGSYILTVTDEIIQNPLRNEVFVKYNTSHTIDYLSMIKTVNTQFLMTNEHKCAILDENITIPSSAVFGLCLALPNKNFDYIIFDDKKFQPEIILAEQENMGVKGLYQAKNLTRYLFQKDFPVISDIERLILSSKFLEAYEYLSEFDYSIHVDLVLNHLTFEIQDLEPIDVLIKFFKLSHEVNQTLKTVNMILKNPNTLVLTSQPQLLQNFLAYYNFQSSQESDLFDFFF